MVLIVIMIMTVVAFDLIYTARVAARIATNFSSDLKAQYLAKAAFNFSKVFLKYDLQAQEQIAEQMSSLSSAAGSIQLGNLNPAAMHLWDLMPISYPPHVEVLAGMLGATLPETDETKEDGEENAEPKANEEPENERYEIEFSDESAKINVNGLLSAKPLDSGEHPPTIDLLLNLFAQESFSELFKDEQSGIREELAYQMLDWVDANYDSDNPRVGGEENRPYQKLAKPYAVKNDRFYSTEELHLLAAMRDKYFEAFKPYVTVFGRKENKIDKTINIRVAPKEVLATFFNDKVVNKMELAEKMAAMIPTEKEANLSAKSFLETMRKGLVASGAIDQEMKGCADVFIKSLCAEKEDFFSTTSNRFKVVAKGIAGESEKRIISVVDRGTSFADEIKILYWRIE
jgi:type II secretory pathway component PulK